MSRKKVNGFDVFNNLMMILIAAVCIYPFLYIFFRSISDGLAIANGQVTFFPKDVNIEAWRYVLTDPRLNIFLGLRNSFLYTFFGTVVALAVTYMTAYVLTRRQFKGRFVIMALFVFTWVFEAGIIPSYIVQSSLGFLNNPLVMIIPGCIHTQYLIITKAFLDAVPVELEEAAYIDGASDFQIMSRVYVPLSTTIIVTIGVFFAVWIWNQYVNPQIYLKDENLITIQMVLRHLVITSENNPATFNTVNVNGHMISPANLKASAIFLAMLPIVCVYPMVQKYFKKGILIGSVKG